MLLNKELPYIYDDVIKKVTIFTPKEFFETISILGEKEVDVTKSRIGIYYEVALKSGEVLNYRTVYDLYAKLKEDFNIDVNVGKCGRSASIHYLFLNTPTVSEQYTESVVVDEECITEAITVDYEALEALYKENDKSGSKDKLEAHVLETYDIDLRKNQTFHKMIEQLKSELEGN